ncbi:MAG TPA: DUF4136 domain-containing protein [Polyangiaceae bacterium]|nr:DUF4136 domain-containing protein [Polyangiaceae bacterium]
MKRWIVMALGYAAIACGGTTPRPNGTTEHVASTEASFAGYHTFSFGEANPPRAGFEVSQHSLEVQRVLGSLVEAGFIERGYKKTLGGSDFIIKLASGTASALPPTDYAEGVPPRGFIGIDVYDAASGREVWQSTAFAEIDLQKIDHDLLRRGVDHMLASVPTRRETEPPDPKLEVGLN